MTSTLTAVRPSVGSGITLPAIFWLSTTSVFTPFDLLFGFVTSMLYVTPRNLRETENPFHFFGMHGSMRRPTRLR